MKLKLLIVNLLLSIVSSAQAMIEMNPVSCSNSIGTVEITSGAGYDGYQWYFKPVNSTDFQIINGANSETFAFDWSIYNQTQLKVSVSYSMGIAYDSNTIQIDNQNCSLSIENLNQSINELRISPNPAHDYLTMNSLSEINTIDIFTSTGQKVFRLNMPFESRQINVTSLPSGIYFLIATSEGQSKRMKFVKL